jgi:hypothetical protein
MIERTANPSFTDKNMEYAVVCAEIFTAWEGGFRIAVVEKGAAAGKGDVKIECVMAYISCVGRLEIEP